MRARLLNTLTLLICCLAAVAVQAADGDDFAAAVAALPHGSFSDRAHAMDRVAASGAPRAIPVLQALKEGDLYVRKADDRVVIKHRADGGYAITDAVTGNDLGVVSRRAVKRIVANIQLRVQLEAAIARLSLASPDPGVRLAAVRDMSGKLDESGRRALQRALPGETDSDVHKAMVKALALADLSDPGVGTERKLKAIDHLRGSLDTDVRNRLQGVADSSAEPAVKAAAAKVANQIDSRRQFYRLVEMGFFGLSLGSVLLLSAIGLAITFGVMGVINMAHGELMMLGAYTTYVVQQLMPGHIGWSLAVAVPAAFLVAGLVGIAIERGIIRFLYGRPLETLLATFGISLFLQQLVRTIFSPLNRAVTTPDWMSGSLAINSALSLTYNRLYIVGFAVLVFAGLMLVLKRTRLGLEVRAVSQNRAMAKGVGVRSEWVDAMTFGLGSGIAGIAGVALSQLTNVGPNLGQSYIIDSFLVVVFGGVGNLWGTLVGALSLGVANKFLEPVSGAVLAKILVLLFIILFIQKRPKGLFPQKGRAAA